jgi:hypothetical protein
MAIDKRNLYFSTFLLFIFTYMLWESLSFSAQARHFPILIAVTGIVLVFLNILFILIKKRKTERLSNIETIDSLEKESNLSGDLDQENVVEIESLFEIKKAVYYGSWIIGYILLVYLISFIPATILFLLLFLKNVTKFTWIKTIIGIIGTIIVLLLLDNVLDLAFPKGTFNILNF